MKDVMIRVFRKAMDGRELGTLGFAVCQPNPARWFFYPHVGGRKPSRKSHPTFEACLPRWVGYPNLCCIELVNDLWRSTAERLSGESQ